MNEAEFEHCLGGKITEAVKVLLSTKHLYQHISLDPNVEGLPAQIGQGQLGQIWWPEVRDGREPMPPAVVPSDCLCFGLPHANLYCAGAECGRVQAYSPLRSPVHAKPYIEVLTRTDPVVQVLVFNYQCQSCRGTPETFLIRRDGLKLTLCGRSPIEHVDVPGFIPKNQREFYSGAIVGYQCGHTLEGLFMLRTLIEQFAYERSPGVTFADRAIDAYMGQLDDEFKTRFPSLRKLYDELSAAIHTANADAALFEQSLADLTTHFDARRLFKCA